MASNRLDDQDERAHGSPLSSLSPSPVKGSRVARMNPSKNLNSNSPSRSTLQSPNLNRRRERDPQEKSHIQEKQRSDALKKAQQKADRLRSKNGSKKSFGHVANGVTTVQSHKGKEKEKVAENGNGKDRERESNPVKAATTSTSRYTSAVNKGKGKEKAVESIPATSFYSKTKPQISSSPSHLPPPGPTRQRRPPRSPKRKIRPSRSSTPEIPLDSSEAEDNGAGGVGGGSARKSKSPIVDSSPSETVLPPIARSRNIDNLKVDDASRKNKLQPLSTSNPLRNPVVDSKNQALSLSKPTTSTNLKPQPQTTRVELPTNKASTSTLKVPSKPSTTTTRKYKNPNEPRKRGERAMTRSASARLNSGSSDVALSSPLVNDRAVEKKKEEERDKMPPRKRKEREGEDEVGRNVKGKTSRIPSSKSREILPNSEIETDSRVREKGSTSTGKNQSNVDPKVVGTSRQALNTRNSVNLSKVKDQTMSSSRITTAPVSDRRKENRGTKTPEPQSRPQQSKVNEEVEPESIVLDSMPGEADDDSQSFSGQGQHRLRDQDEEMIKISELKQEKEKEKDEVMKQSSPSPSRSGPDSNSESESESEDEEAFSQFVDENSMDPLDLLPNKKDLRSSSRIGRRTRGEVPKGGGSKGKGKEKERVVDQDQERKKGESSRENLTRGKSNESRAGELRQVNEVGKNGNLQRGTNNQIRTQKKPNQVDESKEKMSESEASDNDNPMDQVQKSQSLSSSIHQSPSPIQNSSNTSASVQNQDVRSSLTSQPADKSVQQTGVSPRKKRPRNSNKPTYDELPFVEIEEVYEIRVIPINARNGNRDQSPSLSSASLTTPEPNVASKVDPRFWISKTYPEQIHAFEVSDRTYNFKLLPPSRSQVIREVEEMDSQDQSSVGRRNVVKSENGVRKVMAWTDYGQEDPENVEDEFVDPESLRWRD